MRALTLLRAPPRFLRSLVTYEDAKRWLEKIGGEMAEQDGSITVRVRSARGRNVQRGALFDDGLEGREREMAIRRAFLRACEDLRIALD
jgi:hypothetical protein